MHMFLSIENKYNVNIIEVTKYLIHVEECKNVPRRGIEEYSYERTHEGEI